MRITPIKIGIVLGVVLLGGTAIMTLSDKGSSANPAIAPRPKAVSDNLVAAALAAGPAPKESNPVGGGLPPPRPGMRAPINDTDPFTGKPITASSPSVEHKGYVLAFCCTGCEAYRGGWARMSESEKDAVIRRYLK